MTDEINDGGPAFPRDHAHDGHNGMTLRDYFAAKAMSGMLASGRTDLDAILNKQALELARGSYTLADAMLKARAQ